MLLDGYATERPSWSSLQHFERLECSAPAESVQRPEEGCRTLSLKLHRRVACIEESRKAIAIRSGTCHSVCELDAELQNGSESLYTRKPHRNSCSWQTSYKSGHRSETLVFERRYSSTLAVMQSIGYSPHNGEVFGRSVENRKSFFGRPEIAHPSLETSHLQRRVLNFHGVVTA
jgi:hypothetical protein